MARRQGFRAIAFWVLLLLLPAVQAASFYGASYLKIPLQDAQSTTNIHFKFRTYRPNGLLFLAAGTSDYCLLVLENGEIQVKINLGAGLSVLSSTPGLRLNDLTWHEVVLYRTNADVELVIDGHHSTYLDIPGRFFELNVLWGVFVGGTGPFSELYVGNIEYFRGCIEDVVFNGNDVLRAAAAQEQNAVGVTWNCSAEFDAVSTQPVSFVDRGSFLALPGLDARDGGSVSVEFKTQVPTALLLYNAGTPSTSDFISLEILEGKLTASVNEGNGAVELHSEVPVADGTWHHAELQFSQAYIELVVDGQARNLRPGLGDNRFFDLGGLFYVGGIEINRRSRALQDGLQSVLAEGEDSSMQGCVRNLKVNGVLVGLREAEVTQGVHPDCVWEYMCLEKPCVANAECFQVGFDGFRCMCERGECIRSNFSSGYKLYTKSSSPLDLEILNLQPLVVHEGGSDLVTTNHVKVMLDYGKYRVEEDGVVFRIVDPPKHGSLEIEVWTKKSGDGGTFTLWDLSTRKVRYTHDGSESRADSVGLELELQSPTTRLPTFLDKKHRFVFHIQVLPVNDPPKLKGLSGKVFRLAKNTKKTLTADFLRAEDPDSKPSDIVYTVLNLAESDGFFENEKTPGKRTDTFTQADINDNIISYNNKGAGNVRVTIRVSDGIQSDQITSTFRIVPFNLEINLVNNTGISLPYDSFAIITMDNLTCVDNSPDQNLEIRYDVIKLPSHGSLQRLRNNNRWYSVNHFTQRQLKKEKLRYLHTNGRTAFDEFKFSLSSGDIKFPSVYDFKISFIPIYLMQICNNELQLNKKLDGIIGDTELKYETHPLIIPSNQITYTLLVLPVYGNLILFHFGDTEPRHKKLEMSSNFTQSDIDSKRVKYKLHKKSYASMEDRFTFKVSSPGSETTSEVEFKVKHQPGEVEALIINEKVTVLEGGTSTIGPSELNIEIPSRAEIIYNITTPTRHGILRKLKADLNEVEEDSVRVISSKEIDQNRFVYVHGDSENERDLFHFTAISAKDSFVFYGTVHIHVIMKNDNPPVREIERVFNVVLDGERKLTDTDLKYVDPDIDSSPADIQYTRKVIDNGALFHIDDMSTQVYQFTQVDLHNGKIIFRHSGPPNGKAVLRITDGKFYVTGVLEIRASEAYMNITQNTGLVAKRGETSLITVSNLTVETNLDANMDDITYKITSSPKYGEILLNGKQVNEFSQRDLRFENVEYENDNSVSFIDSFSFSAFLDDCTVDGKFIFRIYPEIFWEPLQVTQNKTLYVDEENLVTIDSSDLNISHQNINPNNITYTVNIPPKYGILYVGDPQESVNIKTISMATTFTQSTLNEGRLLYHHTEINASEDHFTFDVSNGITSIRDLTFIFKIISKIIFLKTSNISVVEGNEVAIQLNDISPTNPYYEEWITEYLVIEKPKYGYIYIKNSRSRIDRFSVSLLRNKLVYYVHDGSETSRDWFTLVANATALNKESAPSTVHVFVEAVNDESPQVVNNSGLDMWEGDIMPITNKELAATDEDSDPADIMFVISSPSNGYVALKNDTKTPLLSFTQDQINRGFIAFVHTGDKAGGFRLQVNDGVNYDSPHIFKVTARVLRLIVATNEQLNILPRMQQSITRDHLFVTTNDHDLTRVIVFRVTQGPQLGRLLVENPDGSLAPVSSFTQEKVNKNLVLYEHIKPMVGLKSTDTIRFDIETQNAQTVKDVAFKIEITVGNFASGNLDQLVVLHSLEVKEGGMAVLGPEQVDMSRLFSLWQGKGKSEFAKKLKIILHSPPVNGWMETEEGNSTHIPKLSFNREDLRKKRVRYHHDNSDTFSDSFSIGFYLLDDRGVPDILLFNGTVNVVVDPINDNPFVVLTPKATIQIVQGQTTTVGPKTLSVSDVDGVPREIVYQVVSTPTASKLVMGNLTLSNFTQEDVNSNSILFVHDGSSKENNTRFILKVSDGKHKPETAELIIIIVPIQLHLINTSALEVTQGEMTASLSRLNLGAETNANNEDIWYNITSQPFHGYIFVRDNKQSIFRQADINNRLVFYMQTDYTASEDFFVVTVQSGRNSIKDVIVNITVIPHVEQNPFIVSASGVTYITLDVLNASKLALETKANPKFLVYRLPKFGVLRKANKFAKRSFPKSFEFTHDDVMKSRVFYEGKDMQLKGSVVDSFEYVLSAPLVQPAKGKFVFTVLPSPEVVTIKAIIPFTSHTPISQVTLAPSTKPETPPTAPETTNGELQQLSLNNDQLLISGVVLGLVVVTLIIAIVVKCRQVRSERAKKRSVQQCFGHRHSRVPGSHTAQSDLDLSDHNPSHNSISLSDDIPPPPPPPTTPSGALGGCIGTSRTGTNKSLKKKQSRCLDVEPSLPPPPYILENGEWTEINVPVPTCKVTPLSRGDQDDINETTLKGPYLLRDPSDGEDWSNYEGSELRFGPACNPVLRKNQYWV